MLLLASAAWASAPRDLLAPLGADHLSEIAELRFTFVVERPGAEPRQRSWAWRPAEGTVTRRTADGELTFHAGAPTTDDERQADAQFVNDVFWLAPHLQVLRAGADLTLVDHGTAPLPVGEGTARLLEARYAKQGGGYTPGDAYDLFLDDRGRLEAWTYHEGGAPEPSLVTTFADYVDVGPLELATDHRSADGQVRIRFTDLGVTLAPEVTLVAPLGADGSPGAPLVDIGPSSCRIAGVDVPAGASAPIGVPHIDAESPTFNVGFAVLVGGDRQVVRASTTALVADPPIPVGLERCDVRSLGADGIGRLLASATREDRVILLTLGLEAWLPADAPDDLRERARSAAEACVQQEEACARIGAALAR